MRNRYFHQAFTGSVILLVAAATACRHGVTTVCAPYGQLGVVSVAVRDAASGAPAAAGALLTAIVRIDTLVVADTARPSTDSLHLALGEGAGTYDLKLEKPTYATWTKTVTVQPNGCHAIPIQVDASLQPSP